MRPKIHKPREGEVVKACIAYLQGRGAFVWRNNTGAVKTDRRFIRYGHKGSADILGVMPGGRLIAVECKKPLGPRGGTHGSEQSPEQVEFQREIEERGGLYVLARGVADLVKACE